MTGQTNKQTNGQTEKHRSTAFVGGQKKAT